MQFIGLLRGPVAPHTTRRRYRASQGSATLSRRSTEPSRGTTAPKPEDRQRVADRFYQLIQTSLGKDDTMVALPAEGTMRVRVALTGLSKGTLALDTISSTVPRHER
jgi:hypothetical protein